MKYWKIINDFIYFKNLYFLIYFTIFLIYNWIFMKLKVFLFILYNGNTNILIIEIDLIAWTVFLIIKEAKAVISESKNLPHKICIKILHLHLTTGDRKFNNVTCYIDTDSNVIFTREKYHFNIVCFIFYIYL